MPSGQAKPSDVVELEGLPHAGEVIAGKYQVEKVIGAGGMGVVVLARHLLLNQPVAVKFLHPQAAMKNEPLKRFLREAQAAAALRSEHVARVLDVSTLPSGDPFMVMEYLDGSPLSRVIRTRAPLPIEEAVDYMLQACDAIGEAHTLGIVHRDLKPGNMFITKRPNGTSVLKVLDFGISKMASGEAAGADGEMLTATNMIMGSPQYASPEQLRSSKNVDHRTDIWAMGVILYYMLTGRRPFEADSMSALCLAIAVEKPAPLTSLRPDVPIALQDVVNRCLEKDRDKRMPDVATFAAALRPFAPTGAAQIQAKTTQTAPIIAGGAQLLLMPGPGELPSQPSTLLSNATTEPQAATLMTRGAWTAPPQLKRRPPMVAIQAAAVALAAVVVMIAIYLGLGKSSSTPAVERQVEGVTPVPTASAQPAQTTATAAPTPTEPIIGVDFAPSPTVDAPPATAQGREPAGPAPTQTAASIRNGFAIAKTALVLRDRNGATVGNVAKGGKVKVVRESGGWALVIYAGNEGLATGWAPVASLAPAP